LDRSVNIYYNGQVTHGLTNRGQILGSGLNTSGNKQLLNVSIFEGLNRAYLSFSRIEQDPHFYYNASATDDFYQKWTDLIYTTGIDYQFKSIYFSPSLNLISSKNVNWINSKSFNAKELSSHESSFNLSFTMKAIYSF
jgi:hypothetical protein